MVVLKGLHMRKEHDDPELSCLDSVGLADVHALTLKGAFS